MPRRLAFMAWLALLLVGINAHAVLITLQPGPAAAKDAQLVSGHLSGSNFGDYFDLITNWLNNLRSVGLIEFSLDAIDAGATVNSATLSLYHSPNSCFGCRYDVFRVLSSWDESTVTLDTAPAVAAVSSASLVIGDPVIGVFRSWDVTSLVAGWVSGSAPNFGMWIEEIPVQGDAIAYFASSDESVPAVRPILTVDYAVAVPEPGILHLFCVGLAALAFGRRRVWNMAKPE